MSRKKQIGLQIEGQAGSAAPTDWLLPLLSGAAVLALMGLTGHEVPWLPALAAAAGSLLTLVLGKQRWLWGPTLLALSLLVLRDRILDGFCQWYNGAGAIYTAGSGIVLPTLAASGDGLSIHIFACWLSAALGMGLALLGRLGRGAVCTVVLLLCCGASIVLGRMVHPLPLALAAAMLCGGRDWKHRLLPLGILALFLLSLTPGFAGWAEERSEAVLEQVHRSRYETGCTTLPEGRLCPLAESDAPALVVTMEKPEVLYLRGFTGAIIEDERWMALDPQVLAGNRELLYWLNSREFDLRAQFETAASGLDTRKNTVTVQNVGACSACRYLPFTVCADDRLVPENLTETAAGERYDSFTTVYGGWALVPELLAALEAADSRYLQAEAAYREFVKAHYLSVPEELAEKMQPYWDKAGGMESQRAVRAVLEDCYPAGAPHDPYYATAAVLTLRHFGIPARYAEGYIIPRTTATTVELTGEHAACWAEVYHDGIGWLPMALTPGLDGETEQEEPMPPDAPEETLPPETEPQPEPEPEGGEQVRIAQVIRNAGVLMLLLLLLAALMLLLRRNYLLQKHQALLFQEDIREAVAWSVADSVGMLERMGIHRGNGSLDALSAQVRERFGEGAAEQLETAVRLNAKALFSSRPMTEEERSQTHRFRETVIALLRQNASRLRRFWLRYILCLF